MTKDVKRHYDLEERTFQFANSVRCFIRKLPKTISSMEDGRQVIRASGSVVANYIEANEALSKKDFLMRLKISRREAKECQYFLRLLTENVENEFVNEASRLRQEAMEIRNILSSIILKSS